MIPLFPFSLTTHKLSLRLTHGGKESPPWQHPPSLSTTANPRHPSALSDNSAFNAVLKEFTVDLALTASLLSPSVRSCFYLLKNTCAVCFSGALSLNMIRFRLTSPFLSGHPPAPGGISPHLFRTIQAVICCHSFAIPSSGIPSPHNKAFRVRCLFILHRRRSQFKHQLLKERKTLVFKQVMIHPP